MSSKTKNLDYIEDLVKRIRNEIRAIENAVYAKDISKSERALIEFVRELQLASPRVWEDVMEESQSRRREIKDK